MVRKRRNKKEIFTPKTKVGKTKLTIRYLNLVNNRKPSEQLFPNMRPLSYPNLNQNMKTNKSLGSLKRLKLPKKRHGYSACRFYFPLVL